MSVPDPFLFGVFYSGALMVLCTECWYRDNPWLFNYSPFFLFRAPGEETKAIVPMAPYTRVFSAWHAGGVCFCFFVTVLGMGFPMPAKKEISLALGLLWIVWASINTWRAIHGGREFFRPGIALHSLIGGCGICGYWHLAYWVSHTESLRTGEIVVLSVFGFFALVTLVNLIRTGGKPVIQNI